LFDLHFGHEHIFRAERCVPQILWPPTPESDVFFYFLYE